MNKTSKWGLEQLTLSSEVLLLHASCKHRMLTPHSAAVSIIPDIFSCRAFLYKRIWMSDSENRTHCMQIANQFRKFSITWSEMGSVVLIQIQFWMTPTVTILLCLNSSCSALNLYPASSKFMPAVFQACSVRSSLLVKGNSSAFKNVIKM